MGLRSREPRVDIMVDIESLGMQLDDGTVLQVCAAQFDIHTGDVLKIFNMYVDIKQTPLNVSSASLEFWVKHPNHTTLLRKILESGNYSEQEVLQRFSDWLSARKAQDAQDIYLWGNGILDDNRVLKQKFEKYGIQNPIRYSHHRDVRTFVEASTYFNDRRLNQIYNDARRVHDVTHNAIDDVKHQIALIHSCLRQH